MLITETDTTRSDSLLLNRQQCADLLGITTDSVQFLEKSGYLPTLHLSRILTLSNYPLLLADTDYPVLQQALSAPVHEHKDTVLPRTKIGESAAHTTDECIKANQGWWAGFNDAALLKARFLPVTLRKYTVSVLEIHGVLGHRGNRVAYEATLAGRVKVLGEPDANYVDTTLSDQEQDTVRTLLTSRSSSNVPGPCGKLRKI